MSQLSDRKPRKHRGDVIEPAVKYVQMQRKKNNEDEQDKKILEKLESDALKSDLPKNFTTFMNMTTLTKQIATQVWAEKMATKLVKWVEESEDAVTLTEFYRSIGVLSQDFCELSRKYPILEKAQEYARMVIGDRREKGMIKRKFDSGSTAFMMPHYSYDWKKIIEWRASLKQPAGESGKTRVQYVVIPEIKPEENQLESSNVQATDKDRVPGEALEGSEGIQGSE
jgi:hypothetical protein